MSQHTTAHAPKRKDVPDPTAVGSTSKKARHEDGTAKRHKEKKERSKGKGKAKADAHEGPEGEFCAVEASVVLALSPVFASKPREGAEEMLDSMIMRYIPALRGVVLAHSNLQFLDTVGRIQADSPFAVCNVGFEATIWRPELGMKLSGKINLCSPDHISLLVHRTFNVSIPRHHIPTDEWEFEHGPAENDPEFGTAVEAVDAQDGEDPEDARPSEDVERGGRWIHKVTGDRLGGEEGRLEFTVVGLTIANQMLSVLGSIQPDPFSPAHIPHSAAPEEPQTARSPSPQAAQDEDDASDEEEEEEAGGAIDAFAQLGRLSDEAEKKAQKEREAREKAERKEERKRKRREKEKQAEEGEVVVKKAKKKI